MKIITKKGTTSKLLNIFISDSSSTAGAGLTGLVYNTASLVAYYYREGAGTGATAISLATATLGTWASGGFVEIDATNMPGWYELGVPDAVLATGADSAGIHLKGATNMAPLPIEVQLDDNIVKDAYDVVNHASYGNAKLVRSTTPANTLDIEASGCAGVNWGNIANPTTAVDLSGTNIQLCDTTTANTDMRGTDGANTTTPPTVAAIADGVWDEVITSSVHNVTNSAGYRLKRTSDMLYKDGAVNDASATITSFTTNLTGVDNDFYKGQIMAFTNGSLVGQGRIVDTSNGSTGAVTFLDGYTQAPADTDTFLMMITHLHSSEEIADAVWDEATVGHAIAGSTAKALTDVLADTNELQTNQGNWLTATGFSTHSAADVWSVGTRLLTAGTNIALAKGTGITGFNDLSAAQVNTECDTALTDYAPSTGSAMTAAFTEIKGATWSSVTDTLEAIRNRGDAAWVTGATAPTVADIRAEMDANSTKLANLDATTSSRLASSAYTAPDNASITLILEDTNDLQTNQGSWLTATGFSTHSAADVWSSATRTLSDKTGFSLSAAGIAAIGDEAVEGSVTWRHISRLSLSALAGKSSGGGTGTLTYRDNADTKNRISATADANGNRTAVVLDVT